jgi:hypothetical protein
MSTGPGPTRKPDGTADASVDDIADLLVEDDHSSELAAGEAAGEDNLDVMLETPGPALANPFMPPPPSPMGDSAEENETADADEGGGNLAYEDLLAKLVLPAKAPEPEPQMPAVMSSLPLPEPPTAPSLPVQAFSASSVPTLQAAPPAEERTLVTENPLVAEEQEAAAREGRLLRDPGLPVPVQGDLRSLTTAPMTVPGNGAPRSRFFYMVAGGLVVLAGVLLVVLVLKLLTPAPMPAPPAAVAPTPPLPLPPSAPPAVVEPLPPSTPPPAAAPAEPVAAPEPSAAAPEPSGQAEPSAPAKPHKPAHARPPRPATPKVAATPKPAPAPKATVAPKVAPAPAPAPKAPKASGKKPKGGYADPFDN